VDQPYSWLRYVDAGDLEDDDLDLDGLDVESLERERLGDVDGFIVDSESGRPYYVVVDSGGWFKSRRFLLPVGHARLDFTGGNNKLIADVARSRVAQFPGFDKNEFEKFSADELKRFNDQTCAACSVAVVNFSAAEPYTAAWDRPDYGYPDWWNAQPSLPDRMGETSVTTGAENPPPSESSRGNEREQVVAREPDPSPHFDGRAQPGDVVGIETGGEQTHVGETADDENQRRRKAEKAARKE
jgi:hypothetical protein